MPGFDMRPLRVEKSQPHGPGRKAQLPGGRSKSSPIKVPKKSRGERRSKKHY